MSSSSLAKLLASLVIHFFILSSCTSYGMDPATTSATSKAIVQSPSSLGFHGQYQLLDYGNGMRLEKFGKYIVRRPCPVAAKEKTVLPTSEWNEADMAYDDVLFLGRRPNKDQKGVGKWHYKKRVERAGDKNVTDWTISCGDHIQFALNTYEAGQVGIFPEQVDTWKWIERKSRDYLKQKGTSTDVFRVLNGFAHTGGSTMACLVDPKVQVTHLDAAKVAIKSAKANIELVPSAHPQSVRWILDDCLTFLGRETKRIQEHKIAKVSDPNHPSSASNHGGYHGLIFDPPAFGRDSHGHVWKIDKDMPLLFDMLPGLLCKDPAFIVISCHDEAWPAKRLIQELNRCLPTAILEKGTIEANNLHIPQAPPSIRRLHFGSYVRWARKLVGK